MKGKGWGWCPRKLCPNFAGHQERCSLYVVLDLCCALGSFMGWAAGIWG